MNLYNRCKNMYRFSPRLILRTTALTCLVAFGFYLTRFESTYQAKLPQVEFGVLGDNVDSGLGGGQVVDVRPRPDDDDVIYAFTKAIPQPESRESRGLKFNKRSNDDLKDGRQNVVEEIYSPQFLCGDTIRTGYCVMENFKLGKAYFTYNDTVTLTTQGTVEFLKHVPTLCSRWRGPISLTVYAPGEDFDVAEDIIEYLTKCDACVNQWVSWHLIFDVTQPPNSRDTVKLKARDCGVAFAYPNSSYPQLRNLSYPINVARNVARLNARTEYVFASDIELFPSLEVIPKFLKLVRRRRALNLTSEREVYVLPVFEVRKNSIPPESKKDLILMYKHRKAVSFHRFVCNICHKIPDLDTWMSMKSNSSDSLAIFRSVRRDKEHDLSVWEPFFIGTNDFPLFDEGLTWNGKSNKMQVAKEMCYLQYDFHILDDAFLVHAPGVKVISRESEDLRRPFAKVNTKILKSLYGKWRKEYGSNTSC